MLERGTEDRGADERRSEYEMKERRLWTVLGEAWYEEVEEGRGST